MRIYVSGPMRGYPNHNFAAFDAAAARIRCAGWEPVSPADMDRADGNLDAVDTPGFLREAMRRDLALVFDCQKIALLPGWRHSAGAVTEVSLSCVLGMTAVDGLTLHDITPEVREWWQSLLGRKT